MSHRRRHEVYIHSMKTRVVFGLVVLTLSLFLVSHVAAETATSDDYQPVAVGDRAPTFDEPTLEAGRVSLSGLKGKVVLLNFWATWCEPCRDETPLFIRLKNEFPRQLEIVGAAVFSKNADIAAFLKDFGVNYPTIAGSYDLMGRYNKVSAVPTTFVIGKDGTIRAILVGEQTEQTYRSVLKSAF